MPSFACGYAVVPALFVKSQLGLFSFSRLLLGYDFLGGNCRSYHMKLRVHATNMTYH